MFVLLYPYVHKRTSLIYTNDLEEPLILLVSEQE